MIVDRELLAEERFREVDEFFRKRIEAIDIISNYELKYLCLFSLIETFAQERFDFEERKNRVMFCDFIIMYNTSYKWLKDINPISLYYERKLKLIDLKKHGEKQEEKIEFLSKLLEQFNLFDLEDGYIYEPCNIKDAIKFDYENIQFEHDSVKEKNRYVENLYTMRNKLTHEGHLNKLSVIASKREETSPVFMALSHLTLNHVIEDVSNICWEFIVPFGFLRDLAIECISNFLQERKRELKDPFENYINKNSSEIDIRLSIVKKESI